jgi:hypothetical protein
LPSSSPRHPVRTSTDSRRRSGCLGDKSQGIWGTGPHS